MYPISGIFNIVGGESTNGSVSTPNPPFSPYGPATTNYIHKLNSNQERELRGVTVGRVEDVRSVIPNTPAQDLPRSGHTSGLSPNVTTPNSPTTISSQPPVLSSPPHQVMPPHEINSPLPPIQQQQQQTLNPQGTETFTCFLDVPDTSIELLDSIPQQKDYDPNLPNYANWEKPAKNGKLKR